MEFIIITMILNLHDLANLNLLPFPLSLFFIAKYKPLLPAKINNTANISNVVPLKTPFDYGASIPNSRSGIRVLLLDAIINCKPIPPALTPATI